ncbi:MAG: lipoyl(octanoyl) transferase LipB [Gemmatimonadales bacterium]
MTRPLAVVDLGHLPYADAHQLQRTLCDQRAAGAIDRDLLLLVEHEPTVTLGRGTKAESLPLPPGELARRGLTVVEVERGGDVTWHGPGQLVGYPILDLQQHKPDLHWYLRQVEEALIRALAGLEIPAERNPGYTGVWTGGRKIASIGIHVRRWVTTHGFALNVSNDLAGFGVIVPCGIQGVEMTSVELEAARRLGGEAGGEAAGRPGGQAVSDSMKSQLWHRTSDLVVSAMGQVFDLAPESTELDVLAHTRNY